MSLPRFKGCSVTMSIATLVAVLALAILLLSTIGSAQDGSSPDEQSSGSVLQGSVSSGDSGGGGDVFSSGGGGDNTGGGGDVFSSGGGDNSGGDTFSSGGGDDGGGPDVYNGTGDTPSAYPTPPPRFPCGPNAIENQAWGGPMASGFLGLLAPIVTQACVKTYAPRRRRQAPSGPPVFVYYYINGMNTPGTKIYDPYSTKYAGNWRGSCVTEHDTFAQNVLGLPVRSPDIPKPSMVLVPYSVKVANEIDVMYPPTCNVSGTDPWGGDWYTQNCTDDVKNQSWPVQALCGFLKTPNGFRGGELFDISMSPTDLFECVRQSSFLGIRDLKTLQVQSGIGYTKNQDLVLRIVNSIRSIYSKELQTGSTQRHYFIVTGHSQGNFFAEGVAYNLYTSDALGKQIFWNRLGVISLGSPTSYNSLPSNWIATKLTHRTRKDDGINILLVTNTLVQSIFGRQLTKIPWPLAGDDPPLWNWPNNQGMGFFITPATRLRRGNCWHIRFALAWARFHPRGRRCGP